MSRRWELRVKCPKCGEPLFAEEVFDEDHRAYTPMRYRAFCPDCVAEVGHVVFEIAREAFAGAKEEGLDEDMFIVVCGDQAGNAMRADYLEQRPGRSLCMSVTPDPDLFPRLPLDANCDDGRLHVHLLPEAMVKLGEVMLRIAPRLRVFAWVPKDWPDDQPIPPQVVGHQGPTEGEFRIYARRVIGQNPVEEFEHVAHAVQALPWSQRFEWLEEHGFEVLV